MPRVGILADTHGYLDPNLLPYFRDCDEIWHAGDIGTGHAEILERLRACAPVRAVHGNIDDEAARLECPEEQRFRFAEREVRITHITGHPGRYDRRLLAKLRVAPPDILVGGHSHVLQVFRDRALGGMLYLNPGAAGRAGFHVMRTALIATMEAGSEPRIQVIELGPRSRPRGSDP